MRLYQDAVRPLLFRFDPEGVHHATMKACAAAGSSSVVRALAGSMFGTPRDARLATTVAGIHFPNPVGLGAGYDKNGEGVELLSRMGFGFVDVGSVSNSPSPGNAARPRLFRIPADEGLMVYYGVPSDGAHTVAERLSGRRLPVPLGVTIVETNTGMPNEPAEVIAEMTAAVAPFVGVADLLFISAACANDTTGAHPFSDLENLRRLLASFARYDAIPPVFLNIRATVDQIDRIVEISSEFPFVKGFRPASSRCVRTSASTRRPRNWRGCPARPPGHSGSRCCSPPCASGTRASTARNTAYRPRRYPFGSRCL